MSAWHKAKKQRVLRITGPCPGHERKMPMTDMKPLILIKAVSHEDFQIFQRECNCDLPELFRTKPKELDNVKAIIRQGFMLPEPE